VCKIWAIFSTSNCKILYLTLKYTRPPNLMHSFFTVWKIITFKVDEIIFFAYARGVQQTFRGSENHFFKGIWNVILHILVPNCVRYMSPKSHTQNMCGTCFKKSFSARGYDEIHIQRPVFDK
jgi:hypothetical protein